MADLNEIRYTFDPTGYDPANYVVDEAHVVSAGTGQVIIANDGLVYTHDLILRLENSAVPLTAGIDFDFISTDPLVNAKTNGLETATAIYIKNTSVSSVVLLTAHVVGGDEGKSNALMNKLIEAINLAKTTGPDFATIRNKPALYPPEYHTHELTSISNWDAMVRQLDSLRDVIEKSHQMGLTGLSLEAQIKAALQLIGELRNHNSRLAAELSDIKEMLKYTVQISTDLGNLNEPDPFRHEERIMLDTVDLGDLDAANPFDMNNSDPNGFTDAVIVDVVDLGQL